MSRERRLPRYSYVTLIQRAVVLIVVIGATVYRSPFFLSFFLRDNATTRWIRKDVNTDREGGNGKLYALNTSKKIKIESGREKLISAFNFEIEYTTYLRLRILSANNCYKT